MEIVSRSLRTSKRKRSPPPSLLLQPRHPGARTSSYEVSSLLSFRLPSPSIHWNVDTLTAACHPRACEVHSMMPKSAPSSKWNLTAENLVGFCFPLDDETKTCCRSTTRSRISSARTITPVPSLAFSQTSCSTAVESDQASSPTESQFHKVFKTQSRPIPRDVNPFCKSSEASLRVVRAPCEPVHSRTSQVSSPSLSTFGYEQYQRDYSHGIEANSERPLPPLPSKHRTEQRASEVSFIDWDSDEDEDNGSSQLSRVNARFKRSLADLRPSSRTSHRSPTPIQSQYKELDSIKFGLSVVMENPATTSVSSSTSTLTTVQATTRRLAKRNVTSPGPDHTNTSRMFTSKPGSPRRTTIIGYENLCEMSEEREFLSANTQLETPQDVAVHKDKRRRLSKLSQWVKRRVSSSSK